MIRTDRASGAVNQRLKQALRDAPEGADQSYYESISVVVADSIGAVFEGRIRAALRRAGLELPEGPITVQSLLLLVRDRAGLNIQDATAEGIQDAIRAKLQAAVVDLLGVDVDLTAGRDAVIRQAAAAAVATGRPNKLVGVVALRQLRAVAAAAAVGLDTSPAGLRRAQVRIAQRKYRARNTFKWVSRDDG